MSYGLYIELIGRSAIFKKGWTVQILKKDYAGSVIYKNVPAQSPFVPRKDVAGAIRGTSLDLSINSTVDFEFVDLFTNDTKEYQVNVLDSDNSLFWIGFLLPEQYQESYSPAPNNVRFTASDQLGLLKEVYYSSVATRKSLLVILSECLADTQLNLGFDISIGIEESRQAPDRSVLSEIYVDASIYAGMSVYEVIESIMNTFDASITQVSGRWMILDSIRGVPRYRYDSAGVYQSTEPAIDTLVMGQYGREGTQLYPTGSPLVMSLETSYKILKVTDEYGLKSNMLPSSLGPAWIIHETPGWPTVYELPGWEAFEEAQFAPFVKGADMLLSYSGMRSHTDVTPGGIRAELKNLVATAEDYSLSLDFACCPYPEDLGRKFSMVFKLYVTDAPTFDTTGYTVYYLTNNGWSDVEGVFSLNEISLGSTDSPKFQNFKTLFNSLPISGNLYFVAYLPLTGDDAQLHYTTVLLKNISLMQFSQGSAQPTGQVRTITLNKSTSAATKELKFYAGDIPNIPNNTLLFRNYTTLVDGTLTGLWITPDITAPVPLLDVLTSIYASNNRFARQVLRGRIRGQVLSFDKLIQINYPYVRKFEFTEFSYDVIADAIDVTLRETLPFEITDFVTSDESVTSHGTETTTSGASSISGSQARYITTSTTNFNGILGPTETDVQKALDKIDDHTHPGYLTAITKAMVEAVLTGVITSHTHGSGGITKAEVEAVLTGLIASHTHNYQNPLSGTGFVKIAGTAISYDNSAYLTAITKAMVEAVLTGVITSHAHNYQDSLSGTGFVKIAGTTISYDNSTYLTAITKAMVEAVLTGVITSHTHNYQPSLSGTGFVKIAGTTINYDNSTYLTAITKAMVEAVLTGVISTHTHSMQGILTGITTNNIPKWNGTTLVNSQVSDDGSDVNMASMKSGAVKIKDGSGNVQWTLSAGASGELIFSSASGAVLVLTQGGQLSAANDVIAYN